VVAVALLSNPRSTGNRALLPQVRAYCATQADIFHYEVEHAHQIGAAMASIALVRPRVIAINVGDGTVKAALTELYNGGHFSPGEEPPVAVLPNGKTNLIAIDLGAAGSPLDALAHVVRLARGSLDGHIVQRELIALKEGESNRPVLGMFLGGAGLADVILYCRHRIYPLGLPNWLSHALAGIATVVAMLFGLTSRLLPPRARPVRISLMQAGQLDGRFSLLIVTTLERLLFNARPGDGVSVGRMKLLAVDNDVRSLMALLRAAIGGKLGERHTHGLHFRQGDAIRIEGDHSNVILDGELFTARVGEPITLTSTRPMPFLQLAA
jgi:hypothetical protein